MRRLIGCMLTGLALAAGCGDGQSDSSRPGDLTVSYYQGGPTAGALLLTITGGEVLDVTAEHEATVSFETPFPGTTRVVVTGDLGIGALLKVRVPDVSLASQYTVRVDQVADRVTFSLIDPTSHTLTIAR